MTARLSIDGQRIAGVARVVWQPGDAGAVARVKNARCIGRVVITLAGGERRDALLFASNDPRTLGHKFAAVFEATTGNLCVVDLDASTGGVR